MLPLGVDADRYNAHAFPLPQLPPLPTRTLLRPAGFPRIRVVLPTIER